MILAQPLIQPVYPVPMSDSTIRFLEVVAEMNEDQLRSGYNNLGDASGTHVLTLSSNVLVNGQGGDDTITVASNDTRSFTIFGGSGDDVISGGAGADTIRGGSGNDVINAGNGSDTVYGGSGDDIIDDDGGNSLSHDTFYGGTGDDHLEGGSGDDTLHGGLDRDTLLGQQGNDRLFGESGNDLLDGGAGVDQLTGGSGADTFRFRSDSLGNPSQIGNPDRILDFNAAQGDIIDLSLIDSDTSLSGFQDALFETDGPSNAAGAYWFEGSGNQWSLFINTDAQKAGAEIEIAVTLVGSTALSSDFLSL